MMLWFQVTGCSSNVPHTKKSTRLHIFNSTLHFTSENTNVSSHHNEIQWSTDDKTDKKIEGISLRCSSSTFLDHFSQTTEMGGRQFPPFSYIIYSTPLLSLLWYSGKRRKRPNRSHWSLLPKARFREQTTISFLLPWRRLRYCKPSL